MNRAGCPPHDRCQSAPCPAIAILSCQRFFTKTNSRCGVSAGTRRHKGGTGFSKHRVLADTRIHAAAEFDVSNGRRGKARSVRGPKNTSTPRFRVRENPATRRSAGVTE